MMKKLLPLSLAFAGGFVSGLFITPAGRKPARDLIVTAGHRYGVRLREGMLQLGARYAPLAAPQGGWDLSERDLQHDLHELRF